MRTRTVDCAAVFGGTATAASLLKPSTALATQGRMQHCGSLSLLTNPARQHSRPFKAMSELPYHSFKICAAGRVYSVRQELAFVAESRFEPH